MNDFEVGQIKARQDNSEARMDRMEAKIDKMYEIITEAQGGWKVMVGIGTAGAAVGAIIGKIFHVS
jgi:adenine/guanine phosphoribosyltransferase-like PRPP-binding protein